MSDDDIDDETGDQVDDVPPEAADTGPTEGSGGDEVPGDVPADGSAGDDSAGDDSDEGKEGRYRRGIAITLASLAVLGAFIAILQGNAAGSETTAAREATRLAAEAQAARVVLLGGDAVVEQVDEELRTLPLRPGFAKDLDAAAQAGVVIDPETVDEALATAEDELTSALDVDASGGTLFDLRVEAHRLARDQAATVEERVTWNARASQYETVMTVLGIALFLVGFTAVVGRRLRPPLAVPGLLLAVYCLGWSVHIYLKEIPDTSDEVIATTAEGEALADLTLHDEAVAVLDDAVALDASYRPAVQARAVSRMLSVNPDLLDTLAVTDTDSEAFDAAVEDAKTALDLGGREDVTTLTLAGLLTYMSGEIDLSVQAFEAAVELNPLTPGLQFALSALEGARGNGDAARRWRAEAVELLGPIAETSQNREYAAQYLSHVEYLSAMQPEQVELLEELRDEFIVGETQAVGGDLQPGDAVGSVEIVELSYADGRTVADVEVRGVPADRTVTVVAYERPAEGMPFIQSPPLYYVGDPVEGASIEISTPRDCQPVEYRVDLYVEGVRSDSVTAPGAPATC